MSNVNTVTISGNLTRDPELRHLPSGTSLVDLGIAVNRSRKTDDGYEEETSFFDAVVFGNFAELVARKLRKADNVAISGRLQQDRWENEAGEKRSKVKIVVDQLDSQGLFRSKDDENTVDAEGAAAPAEAKAQDDDIPF